MEIFTALYFSKIKYKKNELLLCVRISARKKKYKIEFFQKERKAVNL